MSIPLTFDWAALGFLKMRVALWWKQRRFPAISLALLSVISVLSGCVPVTRYEETQSAASVELEGRRRAEYQLQQLKQENAQLQTQMQQQSRSLDERDQALSQAELDGSVQGKQRQEAEGMVDQLRGELARVSGHLQSYGDDKQRLTASLANESARGQSLNRVTRDATLLWSDAIQTGEYTLDSDAAGIALRVPRSDVLGVDGAVKPEAAALLSNVSRLMKLHPTLRLVAYDAANPSDAIVVGRLVSSLGEQGVAAERVAAGSEAAGSADAAQLVLSFSVP